jgi:aspartate kinase
MTTHHLWCRQDKFVSIHKFGGTSVRTFAEMLRCFEDIRDSDGETPVQVIVVSAMKGVTDLLCEMVREARAHVPEQGLFPLHPQNSSGPPSVPIVQRMIQDILDRFQDLPEDAPESVSAHAEAALQEVVCSVQEVCRVFLAAGDLGMPLGENIEDFAMTFGERWSLIVMRHAALASGISQDLVIPVEPGEIFEASGNFHDDQSHEVSVKIREYSSWSSAMTLEDESASDPRNLKNQIRKCRHRALETMQPAYLLTGGFVGAHAISPNGPHRSLRTFGRNAGDLSAAVLAEHLASWTASLNIWSNVPGIYNGDPSLVENSTLLPEVTFDTAKRMSMMGSQVIHWKAAETAGRSGVPTFLRLHGDPAFPGTRLTHDSASGVVVPRPMMAVKPITHAILFRNLTSDSAKAGMLAEITKMFRDLGASVVAVSQDAAESSVFFAVEFSRPERLREAIKNHTWRFRIRDEDCVIERDQYVAYTVFGVPDTKDILNFGHGARTITSEGDVITHIVPKRPDHQTCQHIFDHYVGNPLNVS